MNCHFFQQWGQESKIDLNKTAFGQQMEINLKNMGTAMHHLNLCELDKLDEKIRAGYKDENDKMRAENNLLPTNIIKNKEIGI